MPFSLARFLSPNASVTVANAGSDTMAAEQLGQAVQNLDTNAVGLSTTDTMNNKTIGTGWKTAVGSDATGDMYYRDASGNLVRLGIGSSGQVVTASGSPLLPTWAGATASPVVVPFFSGISGLAPGTQYMNMAAASATEGNVQVPVAGAATFTKFQANQNAASGVGQQYAYTLRKAAGATTITVTLANTTSGSDTAHSVAYAAGDLRDLQYVGSGSAATTTGNFELST